MELTRINLFFLFCSLSSQSVAEPIGVICGIVPCTNPTSTAIFKALISLKTRNGIVFSPHPRSKKSTCLAAKLVLDAAVEAGAPADIIGFVSEPTLDISNALMRHPAVDLILATGGPGMGKSVTDLWIASCSHVKACHMWHI
jgi:acetaldehyde dehydrogenase/alcohol dehydrogenase